MSLEGVRDALATQLRASGYQVHDHVPNQIEPPTLIVAPGDPYLQQSDVFGQYLVTHDIYVLVEYRGDNEAAANALDKAIPHVLANLGDWFMTKVGKPGPFEGGEWLAHGVPISVCNETTL